MKIPNRMGEEVELWLLVASLPFHHTTFLVQYNAINLTSRRKRSNLLRPIQVSAMKILCLSPRRHTNSDLHLLHASINSVNSEGSTFLVDDEDCHDEHHQNNDNNTFTSRPPNNCRRVSFANANQVHRDQFGWDEARCATCWYTVDEVKLFKTETVCIAKAIIDAERANSRGGSHKSWPRRLAQAYQHCCLSNNNSHHDNDVALPDPPIHQATASILALDKWVVRSMAADKLQRRRALMEGIQKIQGDFQGNAAAAAPCLASVSACLSRPSRLYAAHVASWWWCADQAQSQSKEVRGSYGVF